MGIEREFAEKVMEWYEVNKRSFPWRVGMSDEWRTTITAILLRKTRAETVAKHYEEIMRQLETPGRVLQLRVEELEELLKPLGLHRTRARQIRRLAEVWGRTGDLPGLGPYAKSLIECLHGRKLLPVVDVNTTRVITRFFGTDERRVEQLLRRAVEAAGSCELNLAVMDLAARICLKRRPKCFECPLSQSCTYKRSLLAPNDHSA